MLPWPLHSSGPTARHTAPEMSVCTYLGSYIFSLPAADAGATARCLPAQLHFRAPTTLPSWGDGSSKCTLTHSCAPTVEGLASSLHERRGGQPGREGHAQHVARGDVSVTLRNSLVMFQCSSSTRLLAAVSWGPKKKKKWREPSHRRLPRPSSLPLSLTKQALPTSDQTQSPGTTVSPCPPQAHVLVLPAVGSGKKGPQHPRTTARPFFHWTGGQLQKVVAVGRVT